MTRPPKARQQVLDAARRIVEERGAAHVTFDELARVSGITRGGITYHFPTKEDLLRELIRADVEQWQAAADAATAEALATGVGCPRVAALRGQLRCQLGEDERHRRFVAGMLMAGIADDSLLEPVREHQAQQFGEWRWDDTDLRRFLLLSAAEGLFWQDMFRLSPIPAEARERLHALIERLVDEWSPPADPPSGSAGP